MTFLATRAYCRHRYGVVVPQPKEASAAGTGPRQEAGPQAEAVSGQADPYTRITRAIRGEKLFLNPGLGRQELVSHFGLTNRQIGALFSAAGTSLPEFIRDCRLEYARELVVSRPDLTFAEIADASGFIHATTFSVDFKHKYGLTPTQYRESHQASHEYE